MEERTFEDILYMIKRSCDKNFYKGTDYDGLKDIEKYYWTKYVTAWQPLPEPYKEG